MKITRRIELPHLLKHLNLPLTAVEVGCAGGSHSVDLLKGGIEHIYMVDNWGHIPNVTGDSNFPQDFHDDNYKIALDLLKFWEMEGKYTILKGLSSEMHTHIPDNSLGLVYIDANHSYKNCKEDIKNYTPKLVKGGILSCHDYFNTSYGVKQAVDEFANERNLTIFTLEEDGEDNNKSVWFKVN